MLPKTPLQARRQHAAQVGLDLPQPSKTQVAVWGVLSTASMAACAFHGYRRNDSVLWGVGWGALGALFPVITPAIAVAEGFGVRKA